MAAETIIQNMIRALGQSQASRPLPALDAHYVDVDERSVENHLLLLQKFARTVKFHLTAAHADEDENEWVDWREFFPFDPDRIGAWRAGLGDDTPAHLALLLSFLDMYREAQASLNQFGGRHLDFYYRDVLRIRPRAAVPDRAHLVLELKKNALPLEINPDHRFTAGKDPSGVERLYRPTRRTVINASRVSELRSAMLDAESDAVRFAPVADSADGLGGELPAEEPKWHGFGHAGLPLAETGFALASPVLRMQEGRRKVTVTLALFGLEGSSLSTAALRRGFKVFLSGEKSWLGPYVVSPVLEGSRLRLEFELGGDDGPVCAYDPSVHGYRFDARDPVLQVQLNAGGESRLGYSAFGGVRIRQAKIAVEVQGIGSLQLENDGGSLNPKKACQPFGPQPTIGSRLQIGCREALGKKLSELSLDLQWKGAPPDLGRHYSGYSGAKVDNDSFTCKFSFRDGGGWSVLNATEGLFDAADASTAHTIRFSTVPLAAASSPRSGHSLVAWSLAGLGSQWARRSLDRLLLVHPVYRHTARASAEQQEGFITLALDRDFLHQTYRSDQIGNLMKYAKSTRKKSAPLILNEPYTPELQSLSLSYKAATDEVLIGSAEQDHFANPDIGFFHLAHSGQMREHAYQRRQFDFLGDKTVALLPDYESRGDLLIGLQNLAPGDSVSLLFQVAEGSADPEQERVDLAWSVLCDNYWKPLGAGELVLDTTHQLRTSGLIGVVIPREATLANTLLPPGLVWLKASIPRGGSVNAVSQLLSVQANAIEVEFVDRDNDPGHLSSRLPAGSIKKLKTPVAAIGKVSQPYAAFGGRPRERDDAFRTRVAERLRHKGRALTAWDIERIVLEEFPAIHKVKCIPHASPDSWLAPGHVTAVLVPSLANRNAIDRLQPKADSDTLARVAERLQAIGGMQARYHVRNPKYQRIRLAFAVRFKTGYEFNYYATQLRSAIDRFLSPWAYGGTSDIRFGGRVYKSVLLDFVEEVEYVDFVTDFRLYSVGAGGAAPVDVNEVTPATPDAILVSAADHVITEFKGSP
jgi:hypothetical protein